MLPARLMPLAQRAVVSLSPQTCKTGTLNVRATLPPRKRSQEELGAGLGCRQQNCLDFCPNVSSAWASRFTGLRQLYRNDGI